jgi:hypothetical protein
MHEENDMLRIFTLASGIVLIASAASAQSRYGGDDNDGWRGDQGRGGYEHAWHGRRGDHGNWGRHDDDDHGMADSDEGDQAKGGPGPGPGGPGMRPPHPPGSGFRLRAGNLSLAVHCDARESFKACVDGAATLMDKVQSLGIADKAMMQSDEQGGAYDEDQDNFQGSEQGGSGTPAGSGAPSPAGPGGGVAPSGQ